MGSIAVFRDTEGNMMGLYQAARGESAGEEAAKKIEEKDA